MMATNTVKDITIDGRRYMFKGVDENDPYFRMIGDGFEEGFSKICSRLIRKHYNIFDIGANIGITAAIMAHLNPEGSVFCFEPGQKVFETLVENIKLNTVDNAYPMEVAVGGRDEKVAFKDESAYGHISDKGKAVDCIKIDSFVKTRGLQHVDFLKIDVEGNEAAVLDGASETISRFEPLIHLEFNSWTLVLLSKTHPRLFLERLFDTFRFVMSVEKNSDRLTALKEKESLRELLIENFFRANFVNDLVLTNSAERLTVD